MCLIVFALNRHPEYRLVLAANRDEYLDRPTAEAGFWEDDERVLAGRDLRSGGTWLGVTRDGRLAAVTNYRDPAHQVDSPLSRGLLAADYLRQRPGLSDFTERLESEGKRYNGFNLIFGYLDDLWYASNRGVPAGPVHDGIHGLSNHLLDTPWPKVIRAKERMAKIVSGGRVDPDELFALMADNTVFPDDQLPRTGVPLERERQLSPLFIRGERYGTRSTTLLLVDRASRISFLERSFHSTTVTHHFSV
jgi:uncharacterized protein with NRDE domain